MIPAINTATMRKAAAPRRLSVGVCLSRRPAAQTPQTGSLIGKPQSQRCILVANCGLELKSFVQAGALSSSPGPADNPSGSDEPVSSAMSTRSA